MKNLFVLGLLFTALSLSCNKDVCEDVICVNDGVCTGEGTCYCAPGFEGDNCDIESAEKFKGTYNVTYTGTGAFMNSSGMTTAVVTDGDVASKILIDVELDLNIDALGQSINMPLIVSVQADVVDDKYSITETTITPEILGQVIPITFTLEGQLEGDNLNSLLNVTGLLAGTIVMEGVK